MSTVTDKLVALNKSQLEGGIAVLEITFHGWQQWVGLNVEAGRALTRETVEQARVLIGAEDAAAWQAWSSGLVQRNLERAYGYTRNLYNILAGAGTAAGEVLEQNLLDTAQEWTEVIEQAAVSSPIGHSEVTVSAVKSAMASATAVIEGISRATRQAAQSAESATQSVAAAQSETVNVSEGKKVQ